MEQTLKITVDKYLATLRDLKDARQSHQLRNSEFTLMRWTELKKASNLLASELLECDNSVVVHYVVEIDKWFNAWRYYALKFKADPSIHLHKSSVKCEALFNDCIFELGLYNDKILSKIGN